MTEETKPETTAIAQIGPTLRGHDGKAMMVGAAEYRTVANYARTLAACNAAFRPKGVDTAEEAMVIMLTGWEVGLSPMASLQEIYVVNGRPALQGRAMLALLDSRPDLGYYEWGDCNAQSATIILHKRTPQGTWIERPWTFTRQMAEDAGLWGKVGPWKTHPYLMMMWRAVSMGMRAMFAGLIRGAAYTPEELDAPVRVIAGEVQVDRDALVSGERPALGDGGPRGALPAGLEDDEEEPGDVDFEAAGAGASGKLDLTPDPADVTREEIRTVVGELVEELRPPDPRPEWAEKADPSTKLNVADLMTKIAPQFKGAIGGAMYEYVEASGLGEKPDIWRALRGWWYDGTLPAKVYDALCAAAGVEPTRPNPFLGDEEGE